MRQLELRSLPKIVFAHAFSADRYEARLPSRSNSMEITAISEGSLCATLDGNSYTAGVSDIITNFYNSPLDVSARAYHSHHTVCFTFDAEGAAPDIPLVTRAKDGALKSARLIDEIIRVHTLYPDDTLRTSGLFLQLLGELCMYKENTNGTFSDRLYVSRAKEYIYDNINVPVMQKSVAAHLGITPEYLCAVFKRVDGRSVTRFINEIKLENIRNIMETKGVSLNRASRQYGFSDPNYVSRLYKKYYGENITDAKRR